MSTGTSDRSRTETNGKEETSSAFPHHGRLSVGMKLSWCGSQVGQQDEQEVLSIRYSSQPRL